MNNERQADLREGCADAILIYAVFLVIFSHVFGSYRQNLDEYGRASWWMADIMDTLTRPGVPLFFMISGFLMLDPSKPEPLSAALIRTARKIVFPLAAWSVLYALWFAYWSRAPLSWGKTLLQLLQEPIAYHLWFIYYLAGLCLAAPILKTYIRNVRTRTEKIYFVVLWVFSVCVPLLLQRYFAINFGDWLVVATGYVGYFVLGQFLRGVRLNGAQKMTAFWLMVLLYAAGAGATYHLTVRNGGKLDDFFFLDWSPNMIAVSVLTFLWIKSLPYEKYFERFGALRPALARVSALSFGIYFMHLMVYEGLSNGYFGLRLNEHSFNPLAGSCLTVFAVLLIAGVITAVLQKIPITREIVPGDWAGPTTPATAESAEIAEARQEPVHLTSAKLW